MAEKLGILNQWLFGDWAERAAINRNAEELSNVGASLNDLRTIVQRQAQEILRLRAMFMGLVEVLHDKVAVDDAELERAMESAWKQLTAPPPQPPPSHPSAPTSDPYRGAPGEPSPADVDAAKALLASAQQHHFSRRFKEARAIYQQIVDQYGDTKQAAIARQQVDNLRNA